MPSSRKIAVLSGKGGTGKTMVSVNLAALHGNCTYADCDVEEPNGHLFFKPKVLTRQNAAVKIPKVNHNLCDGCKLCVEFCRFNALSYGKRLEVFDTICHSCGGCEIICPQKAIAEIYKVIGEVQIGSFDGVNVFTGILNTGEATGVPIINKLLKLAFNDKSTVFIDCPPGSSCTVMESIKDADFCILVAEPTTFGAHNLKTVYELVKMFNKPCGAVLNKCTGGYNPSEEFCKESGIKILCEIPFDSELGTITSNGKVAVLENYSKKRLFESLLKTVTEAI